MYCYHDNSQFIAIWIFAQLYLQVWLRNQNKHNQNKHAELLGHWVC